MQGNFYNDAVIDPYMLERAEVMRGPVSVVRKAARVVC
jgi:iron complex outermembrane receptor protein